jgi:lysophospholipase L1-like esterase
MAAAPTQRGIPLLALLAGTALALAGGEALLRFLRPPQLAIVRYPCIYRPDPELGFRYVPGSSGRVAAHFEIDNPVAINSQGFYDDEPALGDPPLRVLAAGDSFTAAMNVPIDRVWTSVAERALREAGRAGADVVNLGIDGTGTDVHAALLRESAERFAPDAIVLAFFANDVEDVLRGRFERECHSGFVLSYQTPAQRDALRARIDAHRDRRIPILLYQSSYLVRLASAPFLPRSSPFRMEFQQPARAELGEPDRAAGRERLRAALADFEALAAACGCRVLVAPVPPRSDPRGSLAMWGRIAGGLSLEVVDVLPALERALAARGLRHADLYFEHDNHLNALGNELYGRAVAEALLR